MAVNPTPSDPEILAIATAFLYGQQAEIQQKAELLEMLEHEDWRELLSKGSPELAAYYEARTREDLEAETRNAAVAIGVAYAVHHAIQGLSPKR